VTSPDRPGIGASGERGSRVSALCGSRRRGSYNQRLLDNVVGRAPEGLDIVQVDIRAFPFYDQDEESPPPEVVTAAKSMIQSSDCLLLVSPEYNYGVPGYLKNAVDWLSRPFGDLTLVGRPMAVMGASTGRMGTIRGQLHWRQSWHFFRAPVFSEAEFALSAAAEAFDEGGALRREGDIEALDRYLVTLLDWIRRDCSPRR
jgi:chromate reductase, NAD(P)H dehydrogenase (quinone)